MQQNLPLSEYYGHQCQEDHMSFLFDLLNLLPALEQSANTAYWWCVLVSQLLHLVLQEHVDYCLLYCVEKNYAIFI